MKTTILIVDDNPENLGILGNILGKDVHNLIFAKNGMVALNFAKKRNPDLILLDIMMPDMDGFEVCRQLKQDVILAEIPVIFLTAKTEKNDIVSGLRLGAVDYVTKPFNKEELLTRINTHLELQITKKKLKVALAEKEEALATKDKFFSIISHDLANLFSGLLGFTSILIEQDIQEPEKTEYLHDLFNSTENGYNLLKNLLEWSKLQTGKLKIDPIPIVLKDIIQQNNNLFITKVEAKEIILLSEIKDDTTIFADINMFDTVIRNLLSNAIKFTKPGGNIVITSTKIDDLVELSITDSGIGIRPDDIDKLFRVDINHTTVGTAREQGNGLGLILCKEFMEKNNGTIGVESSAGSGSRFYVRIPSCTHFVN